MKDAARRERLVPVCRQSGDSPPQAFFARKHAREASAEEPLQTYHLENRLFTKPILAPERLGRTKLLLRAEIAG